MFQCPNDPLFQCVYLFIGSQEFLVRWSIGPLVHLTTSLLVHWSIGSLVNWSIVHWSIGPLAYDPPENCFSDFLLQTVLQTISGISVLGIHTRSILNLESLEIDTDIPESICELSLINNTLT